MKETKTLQKSAEFHKIQPKKCWFEQYLYNAHRVEEIS